MHQLTVTWPAAMRLRREAGG